MPKAAQIESTGSLVEGQLYRPSLGGFECPAWPRLSQWIPQAKASSMGPAWVVLGSRGPKRHPMSAERDQSVEKIGSRGSPDPSRGCSMSLAGHIVDLRCIFSCPRVPFGTVFDDFGAPFPTMLTDFRSTLDGFLSMVLDDFLTK